jgi:hypothetical protein
LVRRQGTPCLIPLGLKAEACLIGLAASCLLLLELLAKQQLVIQATWGGAGYHHGANVAGKSHNLIAHRCVIAITETLIHPAFGAVVHLGGELGHLAMDDDQRERAFAAEQGILTTDGCERIAPPRQGDDGSPAAWGERHGPWDERIGSGLVEWDVGCPSWLASLLRTKPPSR